MLADIESWAETGPSRGRRDVTAASRGVLARQRDGAVALLRQAGWRVSVARADRTVRVRTPQPRALRDLLVARGAQVTLDGPDQLVVAEASTEQVGQAAAAGGVVLHEMRFQRSNLEDVFLELTGGKGDRP